MKINIKANSGLGMKSLIIIVMILLIIIGIIVYIITGNKGIVTKATEVELEFSKTEVAENFEKKVNNKLLEAYNQVKNTTNDISTIYNENNLIQYFDNSQTHETLPGIDCIDSDNNSVKIMNASENGEVYEIYYIKPQVLSSEVTKYGLGKNLETGDVFTLEVIKMTKEDGTIKSTGEYEIKYYDSSKNSTIIGKIVLYKTNKS